jgi:hypothetical protein
MGEVRMNAKEIRERRDDDIIAELEKPTVDVDVEALQDKYDALCLDMVNADKSLKVDYHNVRDLLNVCAQTLAALRQRHPERQTIKPTITGEDMNSKAAPTPWTKFKKDGEWNIGNNGGDVIAFNVCNEETADFIIETCNLRQRQPMPIYEVVFDLYSGKYRIHDHKRKELMGEYEEDWFDSRSDAQDEADRLNNGHEAIEADL